MSEPEVGTYITYEEIFAEQPTEDDLRRIAQRLSASDVLQTCGKLSAAAAYERDGTAVIENVLGEMIGGGVQAALLGLRTLRRRLHFRQRLLATARSGIMFADSRPPDSFGNGAQTADFVRLVLAVADVYDDDRLADSEMDAEDWLASFYLRRVLALHRGISMTAFSRAYRLFIDLPERFPRHVAGVAFDELMQREVGLDVRRYLATCMGIHARFLTSDRDPARWLLTPAYWASTTISADESATVARRWSGTVEDFRVDFNDAFARGEQSIDDLRPFVLRPLIEIEEQTFTPVDVELLGEKLIGDGLYWRVVPDPDRPHQEKSDFGQSLGHLFEEHCAEVVRSCYPTPSTAAPRVFGERPYQFGDGPDLVVFDPDCTTMIEVGVDRPNFASTLLKGNLEHFDRDIESIVIPRASQLDRKIAHFRESSLRYPGWEDHIARPVFPVVCLVDGFPSGPVLRSRIDQRIAQAGLLTDRGTARLTIISGEELEWMLGLVETGEL